MKKISILTLFPEMFQGPFDHSIIKRAQNKKLIEIELINIRNFGIGRHKIVDDRPYGGGVGMIMRIDVIDKTIQQVTSSKRQATSKRRIILLDARGETFNQQRAEELSRLDHLILIAGHYEGVDERVKNLIDESLSIGDYILTGGEIPAMVVADAITRLIPGVLEKPEATANESFSELITNNQQLATNLEYPQYTRPAVYKKWKIPEVLLSGNHQQIISWRNKNSLMKRVGP